MANPIDQRTLKWLEYIAEVTAGILPTNPAMTALPGDLVKFEYTPSLKLDTYSAFKGAADTDPLSAGKAVKVAEEHDWSFTCKASSLALLPQAMLATTTASYSPSNVYLPFSLGAMQGGKFGTWLGCAIEEWTLNFADFKKAAEIVCSGVAMDRTAFSATDYKGTGSHAAAPSATPYTLGASVTSILYDGASTSVGNITVESLKIGVKNKVSEVQDAGSSLASKIGYWSFGTRELILEMKATILDPAVIESVRAGGVHTFGFTLGGKAFSYTGIVWTDPGKIGSDPESSIGVTLKADPGTLRVSIT